MTTRTRILLASLAASVLPLTLLAVGARQVARDRFAQQHAQTIATVREQIQRDIRNRAETHDARLAALEITLRRDGRLRAALLGTADGDVLVDFAAGVMQPSGFDYLLLLDGDGTVLSSGHFRNEYGRSARALLATRADGRTAVVRARTAAGSFMSLTRTHAFDLDGRRFLLVGGTRLDTAFLRALGAQRGAQLQLALELPDEVMHAGPQLESTGSGHELLTLPFIDVEADRNVAAGARWTVGYSNEPLRALLSAIDRLFVAALAAALVLAFVLARLLAARVNRPLEELARQAGRVAIERHDIHFDTRRRDEVGALARVLNSMLERLRAGALQLRDAERRATVGDMARQVNHDIRNGLLPIRNVVRHLSELSQRPEELSAVFTEREQTLSHGIAYLESLATNYARLSPRLERQVCDANEIVATIVRDSPGSALVSTELHRGAARVSADPVALRRVIENLVVNALESLHPGTGRVIVRTRSADSVTIDVEDDGAGMTPDVQERIFDDFFTTKERGTGLGLSIVRRLVADMGGRISVHSEPGRGTRFTVELPAAEVT